MCLHLVNKRHLLGAAFSAISLLSFVGALLAVILIPADLCSGDRYHYDGVITKCTDMKVFSLVICQGTAFRVSSEAIDLDPYHSVDKNRQQAEITIKTIQNCTHSRLSFGKRCPVSLVGNRLQADQWYALLNGCTFGLVTTLGLVVMTTGLFGFLFLYLALGILLYRESAPVDVSEDLARDSDEKTIVTHDGDRLANP